MRRLRSVVLLNLFILLALPAPRILLAGIKILQSDEDRVVIELIIPPVQFTEQEINGNRYRVPEIAGFDLQQEPGKPLLPARGVLVAIPPNAGYVTRILETRPVILENAAIPLAPAFRLPESDLPAAHNQSIRKNEFYPANWAETNQEAILRGLRLLRLQINPIRFNPVSQELVGIAYLRVAIEFTQKPGVEISIAKPGERNSVFDAVLSKTILNYSSAKKWPLPKKTSTQMTAPRTSGRPAWKMEIAEEGIYRLSYEWLQRRAVDVYQLNPSTVKITNKGKEIPLFVEDQGDSQFDPGDYIEFYARPNAGDTSFFDIYSDINVYWLMWDEQPGLRYQNRPVTSSAVRTISRAKKLLHLEEENIYHAGDSDMEIIDTRTVPGEGWIWGFLYPGDSYTKTFSVRSLPQIPEPAALIVRLHGTTLDAVKPDHHAKFWINQTEVGEVLFDDRDDVFYEVTFSSDLLHEGENSVKISSVGDLGATLDQFYLDWIELEIPQTLTAENNALDFRIPRENRIAEFSVWNFETDALKIFEVNQGYIFTPTSLRREEMLEFYVESAGINAGYFTKIKVNQQLVVDPGKRGINLAIVDSVSGQVTAIRDFDTFASKEDADTLAMIIQSLPAGTYVLAGIRDEGSNQLNDTTYQALESIGSQYIRQVGLRDSWAIIGRKGAAIGSVPELHVPDGQGTAAVADTIFVAAPDRPFHLVFTDSLEVNKNYFIGTPENFKQPISIRRDTLANLASAENGADYLMIYHPRFYESAQRLATYRSQKNGLRTKLVAIQDIYDEFNHGLPNPAAIQQFLIYAANHWQPPAPTAVVFWGDASYDFKMNSRESVKTNFVPSYGNPVSDNWLVCLDGPGDFLPDMLTGRIAIETDAEGQVVVDKIIAYEQMPPAAWQKDVLFITGGFDEWEQSTFMQQSRNLNASFVLPPPASGRGFMINKTTTQALEGEKKPEILSALNQGKLWVNFLGHAASRTWDLMFNDPDILELENVNKYPFLSSMTCHTARFANPVISCFGELFLNVAEKGAIGFWGTSGWGFLSQDYALLQKLFPTVLKDTVRTLGAATHAAKLDLWERFGSSTINVNSIHQYTLIGDPLTQLALPTEPELFIDPGDIEFSPAVPIEADSVVKIKIRIQNFGLATVDSVALTIFDHDEQQQVTPLAVNRKIAPLGRLDSVTVNWPIQGKVGQHQIQVLLDPENRIPEVNEDNNQQTVSAFVYASTLTLSKPLPFQVVNQPTTILQVNSPVKSKAGDAARTYAFEIDTTADFSSPWKQSAVVPEGVLVTRWQTPMLIDGSICFWRCRLIEENEIGVWETRSFTVDFAEQQFQARISHPAQFQSAIFDQTEIHTNGVSLKNKPITLEVQSAGMSDGNLARIYLNRQLVIDAKRGFNLAVIEPLRGDLLATDYFDLWAEPADADSMADFIAAQATGLYVCAAIKDEGSRYLNENAFQALESIGSQYCRQIGSRDSWAIIGIKGAVPGTVPESILPSGSGVVTIADTLNRFVDSGTITSPVFGPANQWYRLDFEQHLPAAGTDIQHKLVGFNQQTTTWDSLELVSAENTLPLGWVDSTRYSKLQVQTKLKTEQPDQTPVFQGWRVGFRPVADLATSSELFEISDDSVITGTKVILSTAVYNAGLVFADSVRVQFSHQVSGTSGSPLGSPRVVNYLPPDSMIQIQQEWIADGNFNRAAFMAELDPADEIRELYHFNNMAQNSIFVTGDSAGPQVSVTFDGKEVENGNWVAPKPLVLIQITDNSPVAIQDTSQITVFLDDARLNYQNGALVLHQDLTEKGNGVVQLRPELENGTHTLEVLVRDFAGNSTYFRRSFEVAANFALRDVLNYPNPFQDNTHFTYILTRSANQVTIKIYTIAGRLIRTIEQAPGELGFNFFAWDGRDQEADEIANGVYLYKIIAKRDDQKLEQIQKLIRMK